MTATDSTLRQPRAERWRIVAALATLYVVWGSTYLAIKIALVDFPPFALAATRFALAGIYVLMALF
jgi:drug/metabolite transporter (DMT)-like permease